MSRSPVRRITVCLDAEASLAWSKALERWQKKMGRGFTPKDKSRLASWIFERASAAFATSSAWEPGAPLVFDARPPNAEEEAARLFLHQVATAALAQKEVA